ncbi:MAG TPA: hypothetical protein VF775_07165, partial [Geobacteraceae bacterium]
MKTSTIRSILLATLLLTLTACGADWFPSNTSNSTSSATTPQSFTFATMTSQSLNTTVPSNTVTITGNTQPAPISVYNGTYSIDGGTATAATGTIKAGQKLTVQNTTADTYGTTTSTLLTVGNVVAVFTCKTRSLNPTAVTGDPTNTVILDGTASLYFSKAFSDATTVTEAVAIGLSNTSTTANYTVRVGFDALDAG